MCSTSSAELGASASDSKEPECEPSPFAKSNLTAAESLQSTGPTSPATETSGNSPPKDLRQTEFPWTSSAEDSRARTSRALETRLAFPVNDQGFGQSSPASFASYDHDTQSWRTSQHCLIEGQAKFAETWPRSGTTRNGIAYRLPCWERPTTAIGSGWLPTPTTKANQLAPSMMKHADCRRLREIMLPTPNAGSDHWGGSWRECGGNGNALRGTPLGNLKIHPWEWEWLMGFPQDWTALGPLEMPSIRRSRKSSGGQS